MQLRSYQIEAVDRTFAAWKSSQSVLGVAATGLGKTILFASVIKRHQGRVIVVAHREELIFQAANKIKAVTGHEPDIEMADMRAAEGSILGKAKVVVSTIQTQTAGRNGGRMHRFNPDEFDLLVIDECFPAGTLIDGTPIERIRIGDHVESFNHTTGEIERRRVTHVFQRTMSSLVRVRLESGDSIVCTPSHPIFIVNQGRYVAASSLQHGDTVMNVQGAANESQDLCRMRHGLHATQLEQQDGSDLLGRMQDDPSQGQGQASDSPLLCMQQGSGLRRHNRAGNGAEGSGVLLGNLQGNRHEAGAVGKHGSHEQEARSQTHAAEQPHASCGYSHESIKTTPRGGMEAAGTRGQRRIHRATTASCVRVGVADGGECYHRSARVGIRQGLQGGHRQPGTQDRNRSGRQQPQDASGSRTRCEEDVHSRTIRVDCVEVLEPGSDGRCGGLCPDGQVYNLEVEGNNNYFANGILVHNCHHATSTSYRKVIKHYRRNPNLRVLGVTATPDRSDEAALGQVFDDVAFSYDLRFGIEDGWLVPVTQTAVHSEGLDLSAIRTTAGDLNGKDLAKVMEYEANLHEIATPTIDLTKDGRKTLIFTASLAHAERLCEILNRHRDGSAKWISGKTPKKERRKIFRAYAERKFQYLLNVGVATEGFDDPGIEAIVMARPTKSRSLYAQMVGRGTRPLPGTVDHPDMFGSAKMRRDSIAASGKPKVEIIDFVGNAGRHKLITTADILGGTYSDEVVERARHNVEKDGSRNMMEALDEAEEQVRKEREEAEKAAAARRANLVADVNYRTSSVDPFDLFSITPQRETGWNIGRELTPKMREMLEKQGIATEGMSFTQAQQLISEIRSRWDDNRCSYKQAKLLASRGLSTNVSRDEAKRMIDEIAKREGWGGSKRKPQTTSKPPKYERY